MRSMARVAWAPAWITLRCASVSLAESNTSAGSTGPTALPGPGAAAAASRFARVSHAAVPGATMAFSSPDDRGTRTGERRTIEQQE